MKNRFIQNPIPKYSCFFKASEMMILIGLFFCAELKAIPEDWPSSDGMDVMTESYSPAMQISCYGSIQVSLDQSGIAILTPKMLLSDNYPNYAVFKVVVNETGKNYVSCSDIKRKRTATVIDTTTGMMCWTNLVVEDKLAPVIQCHDDTTSCTYDPFTLNYDQFIFATDNCSGHVTMDHDLNLDFLNCSSSRYAMIAHLNWTMTDSSGNKSYCSQNIYFKKASVDSIVFPPKDTVYCPNPDLNSTGVPTLFGDTVSYLCNMVATHRDDSIPVCGGMIKLKRTWTVIDWCNNAMRSGEQEILIADTTRPDIVCPKDITLYSPYNSCKVKYRIPGFQASDACTASEAILKVVRVDYSFLAQPGSEISLDTGLHTFQNIAIDPCGNSDTCISYVKVIDRISPTLVCPPALIVSLDPRGQVFIHAHEIAAHGLITDNCCVDTVLIRRMTPACSRPEDTLFRDEVLFCCDDIGDTLMLVMKASDCSGNMNFCMIQIYVQDKNPVAPAVCPADITLSCTQDYLDLGVTGNYTVISACLDTIRGSHRDETNIDSCKNGEVRRRFYLTYPNGTVDSSCVQSISIFNFYRFDVADVIWPGDTIIPGCVNTHPNALHSFPVDPLDSCGSVYFSFVDKTGNFTMDSCKIIERMWSAYSACTGETFKDTQIITLVDLSHSKLTGPRDTTVPSSTNACSRFVNLQAASLSGCGRYASITNSFNNGGANASDTYPVGSTRVIFTAKDSCGTVKDTTFVVVLDLTSPSAVCRILFVNMPSNDSLKFTARGLLDAYSDNCTANDKLKISFSSSNNNDTCRYITCADLQTIPDTFDFTIFVKDSSGNVGSCNARVHVFDPNNNCQHTIRIGDADGLIRAGGVRAMEGVQVFLDGLGEKRYTDSRGIYLFDKIVTNKEYTLRADFDKDWLEGITTQDIVMVQRHILGMESFTNPYQWIAADVDHNGRITGADVSQMRRLVLGKADRVPGNTSWRFVDESYAFKNINDPLAEEFPEFIKLSGFWQDTAVDFHGVKIGDVSSEHAFASEVSSRLRKYEFNLEDQSFERGALVQIEFKGNKSICLQGLQMGMDIDPGMLELYQIKEYFSGTSERALTEDEYNYDGRKLKISISNHPASGCLENGDRVLSMLFRARKAGKASEALKPSGEWINEVYPVADVPLSLMFRFNQVQNENYSITNWQVDPNPFKDQCKISFEGFRKDQGVLSLYSLQGELAARKSVDISKGMNIFWLNARDLPADGEFIYHFQVGGYSTQGKLIKMK